MASISPNATSQKSSLFLERSLSLVNTGPPQSLLFPAFSSIFCLKPRRSTSWFWTTHPIKDWWCVCVCLCFYVLSNLPAVTSNITHKESFSHGLSLALLHTHTHNLSPYQSALISCHHHLSSSKVNTQKWKTNSGIFPVSFQQQNR